MKAHEKSQVQSETGLKTLINSKKLVTDFSNLKFSGL